MEQRHTSEKNIFFTGSREEIDKIETVFQWLKAYLGINKTELYKKALLWIASDEKAKTKFIEYLMNEKAKDKIIEIVE
jgi:transposase-like protein